MDSRRDIARQAFEDALAYVEAAGLSYEVKWQLERNFESFTETDFLRESAWVVLCCGFRESIVRRFFGHISLSFCDWESAQLIVRNAYTCITSAMTSMRCRRKYEAIVAISQRLALTGFEEYKQQVVSDPIHLLQELPYIGPVTCHHLAKNLGLETAKPDRHLVELTKRLGFSSAHELCETLSEDTGFPVSVVDLVLWRYIADGQYAHSRFEDV